MHVTSTIPALFRHTGATTLFHSRLACLETDAAKASIHACHVSLPEAGRGCATVPRAHQERDCKQEKTQYRHSRHHDHRSASSLRLARCGLADIL